MKKINLTVPIICFLTSIWTSQGLGMSQKLPDENPDQSLIINIQETEQQATLARKALLDLQTSMLSKFKEVESNMASKNSTAALRGAKEILDTVKVKTGIDPKTKLRESFLVPLVFNESAKTLNNLPESQQIQVIKTISEYRGGLYMDIMNLSKRTTLLYIKALKGEMMKEGGLNKEDRDKILQDLVKATLVPMPVVDKENKKIIAFDEDIANEDHTFMFNRELKMFLLEDKELKITEEQFLEYKEKIRNAILAKGNAFLPKRENPLVFTKAIECMNQANEIGNYDQKVNAQCSCMNRFINSFEKHDECINVAGYISNYDNRVHYQTVCFSQFSTR